MSVTRTLTSLFVLSILATVGCGGSAPPAQSPEPSAPAADAAPPVAEAPPPATTKAEPEAKDKVAAKSSESATETAKAKSEPEAPAAPPRPPSEILTAEDVAFVLDWQASSLRLMLTDKCEEKLDDSALVAKCVDDERAKFPADVLRFRQLGGQLRWTVYKRNKDRLQVVYSVPFTFVEETDYTVSLQLQGKGSGYQPLMSQERTIFVSLPSVYTIELNDPVWGTLVYTSKAGLVND